MKHFFYIIFIVLLILGSCRSNKPESPKFYLLEYPMDNATIDTLTPLPYTLEIVDIDVNPAFGTNQIALRENEHEIKYFQNHQWASRPQQGLERFVVNYFSHNAIFHHTERRFWNKLPDYKLFITVYNLEAVMDRKDFYARMHVEFRMESVDGEIIERHISDTSRMLQRRNLNLFSKAINHIFYEELNFFARKIHFILSPAGEMPEAGQ